MALWLCNGYLSCHLEFGVKQPKCMPVWFIVYSPTKLSKYPWYPPTCMVYMKLCVWCTVQYNTVRVVAYLYSTENCHWLCNLRYHTAAAYF